MNEIRMYVNTFEFIHNALVRSQNVCFEVEPLLARPYSFNQNSRIFLREFCIKSNRLNSGGCYILHKMPYNTLRSTKQAYHWFENQQTKELLEEFPHMIASLGKPREEIPYENSTG
ncbi:hypothetical protein TVAG_346450 [Trichomonas vaginalis G3]|uniref:Uncharacterized protein n=1 Tax=Trichomonas vaginalis (strain ATCC PRA-98 / G3) TaxID=412133 RepID=A2G294_TRIV3|nr:hypothetical protein TVAGG3_0125780 [Trichomonas vaginalis G3]EAX68654.1 hypothetical protein TVAG_527970 [Trichomonas vaginalis G3]EAX88717.1 hypothetical protein TVAG_346450 [Trichomonas vaginalis G3]KAI5545765.1 hypothetical protein TVAGG3_0125780 [Trichomonas vaginalis G3]|eukprot:XP_001281584.1 hypothetical protein [Trichomonas vaginalis G3]